MVEATGVPTPPSPSGHPSGRGSPGDSRDDEPAGAPSFPRRLVAIFVSPVELFTRLAGDPRWAAALLLGAALTVLSSAVIPAELWADMMRQSMLESGQEMPEGFDPATFGTFQKVAGVVAGGVFWLVMGFLTAGATTLIFAFLMGDKGGYRQHLAIAAHAFLVLAVGSLLITPLRIVEGDVQLSLNLGLFFPVDEGFAAAFLRSLDLFWLWSFVLVGLGMHALDRRRNPGTAVAIVMVIPLCFAALQAFLTGG